MRSFEEFQDYCKEHLVGALPDGYENATVTVNEVIKNNGRVLTALTVMPEDQNVAPNIYLDGFYMEYETGTDLDTIMDEMADLCMSHIHPSQDISNIGQQFRDVNFVRGLGEPQNINAILEKVYRQMELEMSQNRIKYKRLSKLPL